MAKKKSEEKTESTPEAAEGQTVVQGVDLAERVTTLAAENAKLEEALAIAKASERTAWDELKKSLESEATAVKLLAEAEGKLSAAAKINDRLAQREFIEHGEDRKVSIDGVVYEVVDIDTALEIVDKVRKSYVEQDAPVAVLKRSR